MCGLLSDRSDVITVCGLLRNRSERQATVHWKKTTQESAACVVSDFYIPVVVAHSYMKILAFSLHFI